MLVPHVSVIIPTYNRKDYVQKAIDSVLAQTYKDYEIIVVDDGSSDGTGEALQARYGDRIRYVWQENQGESVARNCGVDMARGEFIAFLDSDDLWVPEKLEKQVAYLRMHPQTRMVFSQMLPIDAEGNKIDNQVQDPHFVDRALTFEELCFRTHVLSTSSVVIAKTALKASGGFDPAIHYAEDYDLWLRLGLLTEIHLMSAPLAYQRRHRATQCYYPSAEQNALRLQAYLSALEKFFAAWPEDLPDLKRRAIARQYAEVSLLEAAVGNQQACKGCLEQVAQHDPGLLERYESFGEAIVNRAAFHYELVEENNLAASLALVDCVLDSLNELGYLQPTFARTVRAKSHETLGFVAHRKDNMKAARHCFLRAIVLAPSIAKNTGVLSLLFEAIFGKQVSAVRRTTWRHLKRARAS